MFLTTRRGCFMPILLANRKQIYSFIFSHTTGSQYLLGDYNKEEHCFYPTFHGRFNFMSFLPGGVHAPSATSDGKGGVIVIHNMHTGKNLPAGEVLQHFRENSH